MGDPLCTCSGSIGPNGSTHRQCARCASGGYEWQLLPKNTPWSATGKTFTIPPSEEFEIAVVALTPEFREALEFVIGEIAARSFMFGGGQLAKLDILRKALS